MLCPFGEPLRPKSWRTLTDLPDYLNDRNAMLEAIAKLDSHQGVAFVSNLAKAQGWEYKHSSTFSDSILSLITATAAQLAEAFLRTLGLWKENPHD